MNKDYEVIVDGLGVNGAAAVYLLVCFTNVTRIAGFERRSGPAQVNSSREANSQTLHEGRAENYSLEDSLLIAGKTQYVRGFVRRFAPHAGAPIATHLLAVGEEEVAYARTRFAMLSPHFLDLRLLERDDIAKVEPKLVEGRDPRVPIVSLYTEDGFAVDYQSLAEAMLEKAVEAARETGKTLDIFYNAEVEDITPTSTGFTVRANGTDYTCRTLEIAAGNSSLLVAHALGFALGIVMLPVAGSYYVGKSQVTAKVYTFQPEKIKLAAVHVDPEAHDRGIMRFGPTSEPLPMTERGSYRTIREFLLSGSLTPRGILGLIRLVLDPVLAKFGLKNMVYRLPIVGKYAFLAWAARKIIPSLKAGDITLAKGAGGVRGQLVDVHTGDMVKMDRIELGDLPANCVPAPSPGASGCIGNALENVRRHMRWLGPAYRLDEARVAAELLGTGRAASAT